jgi:hypothetical protein
MSNEILDLSSQRYLNESAIKSHALRCSARFKANRFTRVGEDFVDEVKTDVEAFLRELRAKSPTQTFEALPQDGTFVTGLLRDRAGQLLDDWVARIIQNKVQRHPSCGKTLGRTR